MLEICAQKKRSHCLNIIYGIKVVSTRASQFAQSLIYSQEAAPSGLNPKEGKQIRWQKLSILPIANDWRGTSEGEGGWAGQPGEWQLPSLMPNPLAVSAGSVTHV